MLSLEEAIKHCEEVAEEQDMKAGFETDNQTYTMSETERERYRDCASEHRQLAEWLRELKSIREIVRDTEIGFDNATGHVEREEVISDGYFRVEKVIHEDKGYTEWFEGSDSE